MRHALQHLGRRLFRPFALLRTLDNDRRTLNCLPCDNVLQHSFSQFNRLIDTFYMGGTATFQDSLLLRADNYIYAVGLDDQRQCKLAYSA